MKTIKQLQQTPNTNMMLEDGYLMALKDFLKYINEKLRDIESTMNKINEDDEQNLEQINQLIGRREQLIELKSLINGQENSDLKQDLNVPKEKKE